MTGPYEPVALPLGDLDLHQREAVYAHLSRADIYFEMVGDDVVVPAKHAAEVGQVTLAAALDQPELDWSAREEVQAPTPAAELDRDVVRIAPAWSRLVGSIVDEIAVGLATLTVAVAFVSRDDEMGDGLLALIFGASWLFVLVLLVVGPTARRGRSVGKLLVGTRVVSSPQLERPGWWRSIARTVVLELPMAAGVIWGFLEAGRRANAWASGVLIVAQIGLVLAIFVAPDRRGWHDRAARTLVIRARPASQLLSALRSHPTWL